MWSSTNQRIKALMSARQREKDRLSRPIHVRRADIRLTFRNDEDFLVEIPARALLNDFTPHGFSLYAVDRLAPNVELSIEISHPKHFRLTGKVVWCQYQPSSTHVLTTQVYPYRVGLAFIWKDQALEADFKKFCAELADLYVNKKGLFIEENFISAPPTVEASESAPAKDPLDVPPPTESDEAGPPSEEQVKAEMEAAKTAEAKAAEGVAATADAALASQASATGTPAAGGESAAAVLDALKDVDPATASAGQTAPPATETPAQTAAPAQAEAPAQSETPAAAAETPAAKDDEKKAA